MVEITITLPTQVYLRFMLYAKQLGIGIEAAAVIILENAFPPLLSELDNRPVTSLSDTDLIDSRDNLVDDMPNERAQQLRMWYKTRGLSDVEQIELQMWDDWYEANELRKVALSEETLRRGLR